MSNITTKTFGKSTKIGAMWNGAGNLKLADGLVATKVKLVKGPTDKNIDFQLVAVYESGKTYTLANMFYDKKNREIISGTMQAKDADCGTIVKIVKAKAEYAKSENAPTSIIYGTTFIVNQIVSNNTQTEETQEEATEPCPF